MTHTLDLERYIEGLRLAGGDHDGERFVLLDWERDFVAGAFGQDDDAALSVGRGNGKSAIVAAIACAVIDPRSPWVCGDELDLSDVDTFKASIRLAPKRREVVVVAASFEQSRVIYEDCLAFLAHYGLSNRKMWSKQDSANRAQLQFRPTGSRIRCLGSDPSNAHGLRPWLILADEPAQWPFGTADRMLAALRTGLGKTPNSRLVALGTRSNNPHHWFSKMLHGVGAGYSQMHAADNDDDPSDRRVWLKANPSLDHLSSLERRIVMEHEDALRDPSLMASFKALRLNLGVADTDEALLLDSDVWTACEGDAPAQGPYSLGIDLGHTAAMSAACAFWPETGRLEAVAMFGDQPPLHERAVADHVGDLYESMRARGELLLHDGWVPSPSLLLAEALKRWGVPAVVSADRWREGELRDALASAAMPVVPLVLRGQGFRDGAADVRAFRTAVLGGRVQPVVQLLMRSAMAEARVVGDVAGNWKIAKSSQGGRRQSARDDAVAAAILAVAEAERHYERSEPVAEDEQMMVSV